MYLNSCADAFLLSYYDASTLVDLAWGTDNKLSVFLSKHCDWKRAKVTHLFILNLFFHTQSVAQGFSQSTWMQYDQSLFSFIAHQTILDVSTSISCANACMSSLGHECRAYAYDKMTSTCLISSMNVYVEPGKTASTTSYKLFSIPYTGNHSWQFFYNVNNWLFCNMTYILCRM